MKSLSVGLGDWLYVCWVMRLSFLAHQYSVDVDSCQDRCQAGYCSDHGPKDALVTGPPPTGILPMRALPPADVYFCLPTRRWTPWPDLGEKQPPKDTFK